VLYDGEGRVVSVMERDVAGGVVQAIRGVVDPGKLGHLGPVSDPAQPPEWESARGIPAALAGSGKALRGRPPGRHRNTDERQGNR
jgi:hypothetical protein